MTSYKKHGNDRMCAQNKRVIIALDAIILCGVLIKMGKNGILMHTVLAGEFTIFVVMGGSKIF